MGGDAWRDRCRAVEHHGAEDGHLRSPHLLASAICATTRPLPKLAWPYLERGAMVSASTATTEES
ncbi:hypothetical protein AU197_16060 [Mycobacterium sp. IS-1590]|nr:hypothetical protein AU197_16060 [Mycobacterium sp. IS-1590]